MQEGANTAKTNLKEKFMNPVRTVILWVYGILGTLGFSYYMFIKITGFSIPCFYYKNFGIRCPGCGLTRMFMALIHFDFVSAFMFNPFMFCVLFVWVTVTAMVFIGKPKFASKPWLLYTLLIATAIGYLAFAVLRNI